MSVWLSFQTEGAPQQTLRWEQHFTLPTNDFSI